MVGASALGSVTRFVWAQRSAIPYKRREPDQNEAYDRLAGAGLVPPLHDALVFLRTRAGT